MNVCKLNKSGMIAGSMAMLLLTACSSSDNNSGNKKTDNMEDEVMMVSYDVTVTNLTSGQPMSPLTVVAHPASYSAFSIGAASSAGLELLAEGGDNTTLMAEATQAGAFGAVSGAGIVGPSSSEAVSISFPEGDMANAALSVVTMLVNTNDAIAAINGSSIAGLAVGDSVTLVGVSYDAGTEANSESAGTMPGPADGGEGYNGTRDDIADQVTLHSGVITVDDGLSTSVLTQTHRWDNPTIRVTISRTE